ncbi:low affinity immunoglobulin epsilon Fc receptor [Protobothrops mucrosquamatus]|uniref:low affinity immunoglobulin epsilon Fc receptor n=1 Tax=Protobothrops mucrosquamatus TaxID=103944 RepID=UPI000775A53C|nr:low affinity immunoglobulin epsilon Fc receptor [Protobothrops mucrosquamatus]
MESSQGIYKRCEEPEEQGKKPSKIFEKTGSFLPQSCRGGSGVSLPIIFLVNIASFLLWIIIIAVMTSKYSTISKELEELRLNQTLLTKKGLNTEKQLQQFDSSHSAQETVLNDNLKKLEDDHNSMKKDVNQNIKRIETQSNENVETVVKLINAVHKINASGCQICPKGWLLNKDKCYYFQMESQAWSFAHTKCEQYGGNLVVIDDWNEQSFLASQMKGKAFWIGLSDMSSENNFVWVDNSTPKFTRWRLGEPDNGGRGQDCVVMNSSGQWEDRECGKNVDGWICEKSWNC